MGGKGDEEKKRKVRKISRDAKWEILDLVFVTNFWSKRGGELGGEKGGCAVNCC